MLAAPVRASCRRSAHLFSTGVVEVGCQQIAVRSIAMAKVKCMIKQSLVRTTEAPLRRPAKDRAKDRQLLLLGDRLQSPPVHEFNDQPRPQPMALRVLYRLIELA